MIRFSSLLLPLLGAALPPVLAAQASVRSTPLFATMPGLVDPEASTDPSIQRGVPVLLNTHLLYGGRVGDRLGFPAFGGESFALRLTEREQVDVVPGAFHWHFDVVGGVGGSGCFTVVGEAVSAWLSPGDHRISTLALQPAAGGLHCLRELIPVGESNGRSPAASAAVHATHGTSGDGPRASNAGSSVCDDTFERITVACFYEQVAVAQAGGIAQVRSLILNGLAQATSVMQDQRLGMRFEATVVTAVPYVQFAGATMQQHLDRLTSRADGILDVVHTARQSPAADLVTLAVGDQSSHGSVVGTAWQPTTDSAFRPSSGFSVNEVNALTNYGMLREFAHNFGCDHDPANAMSSQWKPYNRGLRQQINGSGSLGVWMLSVMGIQPPNCLPPICLAARVNSFTDPNLLIDTQFGRIPLGSATAHNGRVLVDSRQRIADYSLLLFGPPTILQQPADREACVNERLGTVFTVVATNDCTYEWERRVGNGWVSTGIRSPDFFLPIADPNSFGSYRCLVGNRFGLQASRTATLSESPPVVIRNQPADKRVDAGPQADPIVFTVGAQGAVGYVWFKQRPDGNFGVVPGQDGSSLVLQDVTCDDAGVYLCQVVGPCNAEFSRQAVLTVSDGGVVEAYGQGCGPLGGGVPTTFYELFDGAHDLVNRAFRFTPSANGWDVSPCYGCFDGGFTNGLNSGDDSFFRDVALGFAFPLPGGGAVSSIDICSNGFVGLNTGQIQNPDWSESVGEFLGQGARIAAWWDDFNPSSNGDVYFDVYPDRAVVSWIAVPEFRDVGRNNFQLQLYPSGEFVIVFGAMTSLDGLVGYSVGGGVADPGPTDLSTLSGAAVDLRSVGRAPEIGQPLALAAGAPPQAIQAVLDLGFLRRSVDLSIVGMDGCFLLTTQDDSLPMTLAPGRADLALAVPDDPNLIGFTIHSQAVLLAPVANRLGVLTSNGLSLTLGGCR